MIFGDRGEPSCVSRTVSRSRENRTAVSNNACNALTSKSSLARTEPRPVEGRPSETLRDAANSQVCSTQDITLGAMVLTAAANSMISGQWRAEPLSRAAWPKVFPLLQPAAIDRAIMDWVHRSVPDKKRRSLAEAYLIPILRDYDFELRPFSWRNVPEAHLVRFFMFSE